MTVEKSSNAEHGVEGKRAEISTGDLVSMLLT